MNYSLEQFKDFTAEVFSRLDQMDAKLNALSNKLINEPTTKEETFTVAQLAEYWNCCTQTVINHKRAGLIPFHQIQRKIIFKKSDIDKITAVPIARAKRK